MKMEYPIEEIRFNLISEMNDGRLVEKFFFMKKRV